MAFWNGRKVLITGGAGFVGSSVTERLCKLGATVRVADNLSTGSLKNLESVRRHIDFMQVDLRDADSCVRAVLGQDVVLNLAGWIAGIGYNARRHAEFMSNNALLQQMPLLAARDAGVERFAQVSSACVYPVDAPVPTPESATDDGPPESSNQGYGWGKRFGERLAQYVAAESDMQVAILRFFNVFGPRDHFELDRAHVIPALIHKACSGQPVIDVWGSGQQTRSFVHVEDLAALILEVTETYASGDPINLGTPTEVTIRDLIGMIAEMTETRSEVNFDLTKPEGYRRRAPDLTKLYKVLGRVPSAMPFREGLEQVVNHYREVIRPECQQRQVPDLR